jgi:hypothetical protein
MGKQFLGVFRLDAAQFPLFDPDDYEPVNLTRLELAIERVRALLNDPDALAERAQRLRDGTAKPIVALI